jgi:DNA repair protein RadC
MPMPRDERPRERLLRCGAAALSDIEVLAVLLRTGPRGASAAELASSLLARCDGVAGLFELDRDILLEVPGIGPGKLSLLLAARELARRGAEEPLRRCDVMSSPGRTRKFLQLHLGGRDREIFCCLFLDSQHRLQRCEDLFLGTLDGAAVYPREVAVRALRYRAAAVILAHNHPSGVATPSAADKQITDRLQRALALLDVRVLDHLVIGRGACFSFAEAGLL